MSRSIRLYTVMSKFSCRHSFHIMNNFINNCLTYFSPNKMDKESSDDDVNVGQPRIGHKRKTLRKKKEAAKVTADSDESDLDLIGSDDNDDNEDKDHKDDIADNFDEDNESDDGDMDDMDDEFFVESEEAAMEHDAELEEFTSDEVVSQFLHALHKKKMTLESFLNGLVELVSGQDVPTGKASAKR